MAKVIWSNKAKNSLFNIQDYIAQDSKRRAIAWTKKLIELADKLEDFPYLGKELKIKNDPNLRLLVFGNYNIIYEVKGEVVNVLIIRNAAENKLL